MPLEPKLPSAATPEPKSNTGLLAVSGAAAATPFAGMIGQKKIVSDPHTNKAIPRMNLHQLERLAKPGDVILSSRPGWEGFKFTQTPTSGSEFFHATPVFSRRGGKGTVIDAGDLAGWEDYKPTVKGVKGESRAVRYHFPSHGYQDLTLVRPEQAIDAKQQRRLTKALTERAYQKYSVPKGGWAALKDLFMPKILQGKDKPTIVCKGQMCSTLPAEAMSEAGIAKHIARGKAPSEVLPADYLREGSGYKPVGAVVKQNRVLNRVTRPLLRYGTRAAIGAGLGGALYGTGKDPVATSAVAAGALTPAAIRGMLTKAYQRNPSYGAKDVARVQASRQLPTLKHTLLQGFTPDPTMTDAMRKTQKSRLLTRSLPLSLAAGLGTYLAGNKLQNWIKARTASKSQGATQTPSDVPAPTQTP